MIGKNVLHYKIIEKLGEGGMGVVYLAEDTKLKRQVAIKFLPRHVSASAEERKRFETEAQAAAALNHPNITQIYAIEEAEDQLFIVMEYVDGKELRDLINTPLTLRQLADPTTGVTPSRGDLDDSPFEGLSGAQTGGARRAGDVISIDSALSIATQIAEGLQAAHIKGIIHRDIKSSNIMITDEGKVKIMDFGLAKVGQGMQLTKEQSTLGTVAYMSPEQTKGEKVDHRADIWSFGVVLYEMLTGKLPFQGDYEQAIMYSILNENPQPLTSFRSGVPSKLEKIVNKAMIKKQQERYQDTADLIVDLKNLKNQQTAGVNAPKTVSVTSRPKRIIGIISIGFVLSIIVVMLYLTFRTETVEPIDSIAVLPFDNLSRDPEQEYFVDGMTEAIIMELSKISALRVISRTSVMQYKNVKRPLSEIANELNVKSILEGSVIQSEGQVRITTQLIGLSPERHLWANNYDRELINFLNLSSEVATEIANEIKITVTPGEQIRLKRSRPVNPEANRLSLMAKYQLEKSTSKESTEKGINYLKQAIEIDSLYAPAYVGLSDAYLKYAGDGYAAMSTVLPKAKTAVFRALELDSTMGTAYATLAYIRFQEKLEWAEILNYLQRAIKLNPNSAVSHEWYGEFLSWLGRHEEAINEFKLAQKLDPLSLSINTSVGRGLYYARKYDEAIEAFRSALEFEPEAINPKFWLAVTYAQKGMYEEAIAEFLSRKVPSPETNWALGCTYALAGNPDKARKILDFLLEKEKRTYVPRSLIGRLYIALGQKDKAFEWLQREGRILNIKIDPWFDPLRGDPRFQELVLRMNLPLD